MKKEPNNEWHLYNSQEELYNDWSKASKAENQMLKNSVDRFVINTEVGNDYELLIKDYKNAIENEFDLVSEITISLEPSFVKLVEPQKAKFIHNKLEDIEYVFQKSASPVIDDSWIGWVARRIIDTNLFLLYYYEC